MQIKRTLTTQPEKKQPPKKQVPIDKKLRMAQYIREENLDNRMKIRQRERLLYGMDNSLPLWDKGNALHREEAFYTGAEEGNMQGAEPEQPFSSTFKLRMAIAIALFIGFLLCDAGQYDVFGYSMNDVYGMISEDYFQINDSENEQNRIQLTELFKF
ncbi:MAG: hypothetical protein NC318_04580 [Blautia sp.]|nr:hypothetical protein [Lachnoclostridium sp.]MCM1210857.1 hypothetical protein [Blautia sp.]